MEENNNEPKKRGRRPQGLIKDIKRRTTKACVQWSCIGKIKLKISHRF